VKGVRGEVLDKFRVELEAVPGLRQDFCEESEKGGRLSRGGRGGGFPKMGDGQWGGPPSGDGVGGRSVERRPVSKAGCAFE